MSNTGEYLSTGYTETLGHTGAHAGQVTGYTRLTGSVSPELKDRAAGSIKLLNLARHTLRLSFFRCFITSHGWGDYIKLH